MRLPCVRRPPRAHGTPAASCVNCSHEGRALIAGLTLWGRSRSRSRSRGRPEPRKDSRSPPARRRIRSPVRRDSRSPPRKRARSPPGGRSRSPLRRRSPSGGRRSRSRSRSPRRYRSPPRRDSRSPRRRSGPLPDQDAEFRRSGYGRDDDRRGGGGRGICYAWQKGECARGESCRSCPGVQMPMRTRIRAPGLLPAAATFGPGCADSESTGA
jgi:hypothetical protein